MQKINHIYNFALTFLFVSLAVSVYAQKLDAPILKFGSACATSTSNNYKLDISFTGGAFDDGNVFNVEMSDADGSFYDTPLIVGSLSSQCPGSNCYNNWFFDIEASFSVPETVYGSGYKVRIRSTSPVDVSDPSPSFEAYYRDVSELLILNNQEDVVLCGDPVTISVNKGNEFKYRWFKDGQRVQGETSNSLSVSESGDYFARIDVGSCTENDSANPPSTIITVTKSSSSGFSVSIAGPDNVKLCSGASHALNASIDNVDYKYKWYKDGVQIPNLPDYSPTLNLSSTFDKPGTYYVEIGSGCVARSQDVVIELETDGNEGLSIVSSSASNTICSGDSVTLSVDVNQGNVNDFSYKWFKDDVEFPTGTGASIQVSESAKYTVNVTHNQFKCLSVLETNVVPFNAGAVSVSLDSNVVEGGLVTIKTGLANLKVEGADEYIWYYQSVDPANEVATGEEFNMDLNVNQEGVYVVVAKSGGCSIEKEIEVVIYNSKVIPNIISPFNADGANDTWVLPLKFMKPSVEVAIYDTSGKEVFVTNNYQNNWPQSNNLAKAMLFYYRIKENDAIIKSGTISVLE